MKMFLGMRGLTLPGALVLGAMGAGMVLTPPAMNGALQEAGGPDTAGSLVSGFYTNKLEALYGEKLAPREASVRLWGAIDYGLFGTARSGAVAGKDGWLFTSEEYRKPEGAADNLAANLDYIAQAARELHDTGIDVVVALLPTKASIYPDQVGAKVPGHRSLTRLSFLAGLNAASVPYVDLLAPMEAAKAEGSVFLARDTHWTPHGASAAAAAVANAVRDIDLASTTFVRAELPEIRNDGDLTRFTPVGGLRDALGLSTEAVVPVEAVADSGGALADSLFGAPEIPVALVGTSYSAQEQWSFAVALRIALQADVLNLAEDGGGPIKPMAAFLKGLADMENPPQLVIWEWPIRFADTDYRDVMTAAFD